MHLNLNILPYNHKNVIYLVIIIIFLANYLVNVLFGLGLRAIISKKCLKHYVVLCKHTPRTHTYTVFDRFFQQAAMLKPNSTFTE